MMKLTVQDKKTIEKCKKKVHSQYPGAYLAPLDNGYYTILQESDDSIIDVLGELLLMPGKTPIEAWQRAVVTSKTTQNLNRTHPLRIEGMNMADKIRRVEERRNRSETNKEFKRM
jgi:hypothetical protein